MSNTKEQLKKEIDALYDKGVKIFHNAQEYRKLQKAKPNESTSFPIDYQSWYTETLPIIRQIIPERYEEFQHQYRIDKRKAIDYSTYTISDYFLATTFPSKGLDQDAIGTAFHNKFQLQLLILQSAKARLDSNLSDIQGILQAELFDDELSAADDLLKKGHLRAAGTLAGVTLERHLLNVLANHALKLSKKDPSIAELNNELKTQKVYDVPDWRFIERLGDIRNYCAHQKEREPTKVEVTEMIEGVQKIIKTIF